MVTLLQGLLANLAVVAILVTVWAQTSSWHEAWQPRAQEAAFGSLAGIGTVMVMSFPAELEQGFLFDLRSTLIALSGFFGGPLAGAVTALFAGAYRAWLGGPGALSGIIGIGITMLTGIVGHRLLGNRERLRRHIFALALATAVGVVASISFVPEPIRSTVFREAALPLGLLAFISTVVVGLSLLLEDRRLKVARENLAYRTIINALPDSLNIKDLDGRFVIANPATAELMGAASPAELIGKTDFDYYPAADAKRFREDELAALANGQSSMMAQELSGPANNSRWLWTIKVPLRDAHNEIIGLVTHNHDVTEHRRLEQELLESRNQLSSALTQMADGLAAFDKDGKLIFSNNQYRAYFPLTSDLRVPGTSFRTILEAVVERGEQVGATSDDGGAWIDQIAASLHRDSEEEVHLFNGHWLHVRTRPTADGSSMVVVSDITKVKEAETKLLVLTEQLKLLASTDGLTGLMNRRAFDEALEAELGRSSRDGSAISLLMVDIDRFKAFNDQYGHLAGDDCLKVVSNCLKETLKRPGDIVARFGGEEFVVLLPDTAEEGAFHIADSFRRALRGLGMTHVTSEKGVVTASIGIATYLPTDTERSASDLIARADSALYVAKAGGRDRVNGWRGTIRRRTHTPIHG